MVARLRSITPDGIAGAAQFRLAEHRELLLCGLRLAAGEPMRASLWAGAIDRRRLENRHAVERRPGGFCFVGRPV
jgi:hypothetical protein